MKIIIGGDLVPTASNEELFLSGDAQTLVGKELLEVLGQADYRVFNLEVPISIANNMIMKHGPCLHAKEGIVNGLKAIGADVLSLANNHIFDCGIEGIETTIQTLSKTGMGYVGAGRNSEEARQPYYLKENDFVVGLYSLAEHEFADASCSKAGANTIDFLNSFDEIYSIKGKCDYLIILYHGGKIGYRYPSPELQRVCHKMIDVGADLVILQHSHCVGCEEIYKGNKIIYGQGNFLFDYNADRNDAWNEGLLIRLELGEEKNELEYIPVLREENHVRLADENNKSEIMKNFMARSEDIKKEKYINDKYSEFASKSLERFYFDLHGNCIHYLIMCIKRKFGKQFQYDRKHKMLMLNYFRCESIRELIIEALEENDLYDDEV